ncbi:jg14101 [Pararge aegeria aegeria]|uniref:Jg14101 protein n=1 Tax=Pararge aegeria aegeria TaxID=348720 RepID=A0A8S4RZ29_9NEOP|nr:jg14101 [Pararge aegeria aegeria]
MSTNKRPLLDIGLWPPNTTVLRHLDSAVLCNSLDGIRSNAAFTGARSPTPWDPNVYRFPAHCHFSFATLSSMSVTPVLIRIYHF